MNKEPVILIITAECGEPQFAEQIKQIQKQKGVDCRQVVISNLPTLEAEQKIYEAARDAGDVDWILRLDGDMTFNGDQSIRHLVDEAIEAGNPDRYTTPVDDFYTGKPLMGVHLMRTGSIPSHADVKEFRPEQWIQDLRGVIEWKPETIHVKHGYNPDANQVIRFALHRALKATEGKLFSRHWITLNRIRLRYKKNQQVEMLRLLYIAMITGLEMATYEYDKTGWSSVDYNSESNKHIKEEIFERMRNQAYIPDHRWILILKFYLYHLKRKLF